MQTLIQIQESFEQYVLNHKFRHIPPGLYEPINYLMALGGKRLRPAVLLLAHSLFDEDWKRSLPAAYAIELFHNFTLMHDDIMDNAPMRRGKESVWKKFGVNAGILSGDVMLVWAYEYLLQLNTSALPEILTVFNRTAIEVCEGQQMDLNFENQNNVTIDEYLKMIELKTSVLLAASLKIGALAGGATLLEAEALYEFGKNIGIAFQIQDDLLDTYGDPQKFGKKIGGDIVQNKKTFLYLKAMEMAHPIEKAQLANLYASKTDEENVKIKTVLNIFNRLSVRDLAENIKQDFLNKALHHLSFLSVQEEKKFMLSHFANALLNREL